MVIRSGTNSIHRRRWAKYVITFDIFKCYILVGKPCSNTAHRSFPQFCIRQMQATKPSNTSRQTNTPGSCGASRLLIPDFLRACTHRSSAMDAILVHPDFVEACALLQYFGLYLKDMPTHPWLAEIILAEPREYFVVSTNCNPIYSLLPLHIHFAQFTPNFWACLRNYLKWGNQPYSTPWGDWTPSNKSTWTTSTSTSCNNPATWSTLVCRWSWSWRCSHWTFACSRSSRPKANCRTANRISWSPGATHRDWVAIVRAPHTGSSWMNFWTCMCTPSMPRRHRRQRRPAQYGVWWPPVWTNYALWSHDMRIKWRRRRRNAVRWKRCQLITHRCQWNENCER